VDMDTDAAAAVLQGNHSGLHGHDSHHPAADDGHDGLLLGVLGDVGLHVDLLMPSADAPADQQVLAGGGGGADERHGRPAHSPAAASASATAAASQQQGADASAAALPAPGGRPGCAGMRHDHTGAMRAGLQQPRASGVELAGCTLLCLGRSGPCTCELQEGTRDAHTPAPAACPACCVCA
jgi:hypothetical protein